MEDLSLEIQKSMNNAYNSENKVEGVSHHDINTYYIQKCGTRC